MEDIMELNGMGGLGLLDLYAVIFGVDGNTLYDLAYRVANHKDDHDGDVEAVIADFVYSKFRSDMVGYRRQGMTFDEYVAHHVRFPYGPRNEEAFKETFIEYLRGVWDDAASFVRG